MHEPAIVDAVLKLASKPAKECLLCYLGTATYDLAANREKQVSGFRSRGVAVEALDVARMPPTPGAVEALLARADIVLVSGGNTLFAVDRWKRFGLDEELRKAAARGCVLTGGSAGAICWFDAGHSDSADPESYADAMLAGASAAASTQGASASGGDAKPWEYIRCGGSASCPDCAARTTTGPSRTACSAPLILTECCAGTTGKRACASTTSPRLSSTAPTTRFCL